MNNEIEEWIKKNNPYKIYKLLPEGSTAQFSEYKLFCGWEDGVTEITEYLLNNFIPKKIEEYFGDELVSIEDFKRFLNDD